MGAVQIDAEHGVARVRLNRPDVGNAVNLQMAQELEVGLRSLSVDPSVRVLVLSGVGAQFCVGGDLGCPVDDDKGVYAHVSCVTTALHAAVAVLVRMDAPVLVLAKGIVAGAGVGLMAAADFVLAADSTRLKLAYSGVGLTPDCGVSFLLPQIVGRTRALELFLTNRTLLAHEALQWGLVNQLVAAEVLTEAGQSLAGRLAGGPTRAFGRTKRLVAEALAGFEAHMAVESRTIAEQRLHPEGREGVSAFFQRRAAVFV
jgi:2-(1,2-epoxy-1,2-dihydrophenyl)acetyl-CoA isomerase